MTASVEHRQRDAFSIIDPSDNDSIWIVPTPVTGIEMTYEKPTNWRRTKSLIKWRAKNLIPGLTYAMGCRGHPGLVIERRWAPWWGYRDLFGADISIKSLVDGVEESCSLKHCAPMPISKQEAEARAEEIRTMHDADIAIKHGHTLEDTKEWIQDWINRGVLYYVLHDQEGYTVRSGRAFTREEAEADIAHTQGCIDRNSYNGKITNPRIVDMLTYPAPIKSFEVELAT